MEFHCAQLVLLLLHGELLTGSRTETEPLPKTDVPTTPEMKWEHKADQRSLVCLSTFEQRLKTKAPLRFDGCFWFRWCEVCRDNATLSYELGGFVGADGRQRTDCFCLSETDDRGDDWWTQPD